MNFIFFLLIGAAAGWLAGKLTTGSGFGLLGNLIIGVIGALVGGLLIRLLGFTATGLLGELISATIGAILLLFALAKLKRSGVF